MLIYFSEKRTFLQLKNWGKECSFPVVPLLHVRFSNTPIVHFLATRVCIKQGQPFFSCILGEEVSEKNQKSRESLCIKYKDSFLKNKFAMLSDSTQGGFFCFLVKIKSTFFSLNAQLKKDFLFGLLIHILLPAGYSPY